MNYNLVGKVISSRASLIEFLIAAVVLAISASGIASIIFYYFQDSLTHLFLSFSFILILSMSVLAKRIGSVRRHKLKIEGYINTDPKENVLIDIPRYSYGEDLVSFLTAAFKENPALLTQWNKEPLGSAFSFDLESEVDKKKSTAAAKLIKEATEYYVLDSLSIHLSDYFNKEKYSSSELREYSRKDVPDILLSNRFMELFTAPMENRAPFDHNEPDGSEGEVVMSHGIDGEIYHRFDLILPAKTVISRDESGAIRFDTEYFTLIFEVQFDEFSYVSPRGFEEHYLGITSFERSREYKIDVEFDVEFKLSSFFKNNKWDYHAWVDGFLSSLEKDMSASAFFDHIQWDLAYTLIQCNGSLENKK